MVEQLPKLPEPSQQLIGRGEDSLLRWQVPLDETAYSPWKTMALLALTATSDSQSTRHVYEGLVNLAGDRAAMADLPRPPALRNFLRDRLVPSGLCETEERRLPRDGRESRYACTAAGRDAVPLLGVLATWQLRQGHSMRPLVGRSPVGHQNKPYAHAATLRLRILQELTLRGRITPSDMQAVVPKGQSAIYDALGGLAEDAVVLHYSKFEPAHRKLEITPPGDAHLREKGPLANLARACASLIRKNGGSPTIVSGDQILEIVQRRTRRDAATRKARDRLTQGRLSFVRFVDSDIFGEQGGNTAKRSAFYLNPALMEPIAELLTSILSLDDKSYGETARTAAHAILDDPSLASAFLALSHSIPADKRPAELPATHIQSPAERKSVQPKAAAPSEHKRAKREARKGHILPSWLANQIETTYETPTEQEQVERSLTYLLNKGILILNNVRNDTLPSIPGSTTNEQRTSRISYAADILLNLPPAQLRLLARIMKVEPLLYGHSLPLQNFKQALRVPPDVRLDEHMKNTVYPRLNYVLQNRTEDSSI